MPLKKFSYPSPRVLQLDAGILDGELYSLLKQQLADSFQLLSPKSFSYNLHPELWSLLLKLVLFRVTTLKSGSSYGFKLQNLKLSDKRTGDVIGKKIRYFLLSAIFGQFLFEKAKSYLYNLDEGQLTHRKVWVRRLKQILYKFRAPLLRFSDDLVKIAGLINFVLFLIQGRYASLLHRILGIIITPLNPDLLKFNGDNVSFEFQNRQLVWNVMTEFLVFVIPLMQVQKWRRLVNSMISKGHSASNSAESTQTRFTTLPKSQCAICIEMAESSGIKAASTLITNPYVTNCGHIFCYICLATRKNAIENGNELAELCPRCNNKITSFMEYEEEEDQAIKNASIIVEYDDISEKEELHEAEKLKEDLSVDPTNEKNELDLDDEDNADYSDNEDLEEELDQESDMDDDYDTEIEVE